MCKIIIDTDTQTALSLAQELEARDDVTGIQFKYSTRKKFNK